MKQFRWWEIPLSGVNLIEASAGTGKTYTIAALYLRLILEKGLAPENILVVTFTQAATNELRERIRGRLEEARGCLLAGEADPELEAILARSGGISRAVDNLETALALFDQAAIFTIHGFCQRVLQEFAFESGALFDTELVSDQSRILIEIAEDFWRRHVYDGPDELGGYIEARAGGVIPASPEDLARLWQMVPGPDALLEPRLEDAPLDGIEPFRGALGRVVESWPEVSREVMELLAQDTLNGRIYGGIKAAKGGISRRAKWLARLDRILWQMVSMPGINFPLNEQIQKITTQYLNQKVKKGKVPPSHRFFDLCQQLWDCGQELEVECRHYLLRLQLKFLQQAGAELKARKKRLNLQYFDDLLLDLWQSLETEKGAELARVLNRRYRAALVDEFQDTDPVQYRIFNRLFDREACILFMIGDPKQAIYGFRSADIFAYLDAARRARKRYTLNFNWRSSKDLVEAVDGLFANHPNPFVFRQIQYRPVQAASRADNPPDGGSKLKGAPLQLWPVLPEKEGDKPLSREKAAKMVLDAVAWEITELLTSSSGCRPQDIAVLTRTNRQALLVKETLLKRGIPAALFSTGSVFDTDEAEQLFYCLAAIAEPERRDLVKAALMTDLIRHSAALETGIEDDQSLDRVWQEFQAARRDWVRYGFYPMFQRWMSTWQIRQRLLALPDGARRFTNLIHLGELLLAAEIENDLGIGGILQFLAERLASSDKMAEQEQLRLENDRGNVLILTAHRSKGLEFEVVFCPFLWSEPPRGSSEPLIFHDEQRQWRLVVDLDPESDPTRVKAAKQEILAENLRLVYVSVTRARQRCYLAWGLINKTADSALAYLLHGPWMQNGDFDPEAVARRVDRLGIEDFKADLDRIVKAGKGKVSLVALPKDSGKRPLELEKRGDRLPESRVFPARTVASRKVTSFSSLVGEMQRDELDRPRTEFGRQAGDAGSGLVDFPRGTRAGLFFHHLLENTDWSQPFQKEMQGNIDQALLHYGFERRWSKPVMEMLVRLRELNFPGPKAPFCLGQLEPGRWVNEMEFYLSLKPLAPEKLRAIFARYGLDPAGELFSLQMERLDFSPVSGYLRGFMDMVFESGGRFYLVDWKSNDLGGSPGDYSPQRLMEVMAQDYYFLQYCLYSVALDRHLANIKAGYEYQSHFGGVVYVFLRGVALEGVDGNGFFHIRPHSELIKELASALIANRQ